MSARVTRTASKRPGDLPIPANSYDLPTAVTSTRPTLSCYKRYIALVLDAFENDNLAAPL